MKVNIIVTSNGNCSAWKCQRRSRSPRHGAKKALIPITRLMPATKPHRKAAVFACVVTKFNKVNLVFIIYNKTKYFRLRLSDEVGTERPETDLRLT